jgi:hypothetical protein
VINGLKIYPNFRRKKGGFTPDLLVLTDGDVQMRQGIDNFHGFKADCNLFDSPKLYQWEQAFYKCYKCA